MKKICFFILFIIFCSCSKEDIITENQIQNVESQLCMSGYVCEDSICVILTKNLPRSYNFTGVNPYLITDTAAIIKVFENGSFFCYLEPKKYIIQGWADYPYDKVYYVSHKKAKEGNTYSIEVTHNDYKRISAETVLPFKVPVISVDTFTFYKDVVLYQQIIDSFTFIGYKKNDTTVLSTMFTINFQDPPVTKNYYMLEVINNRVTYNYDGFTLDDLIMEYEYPEYLFSDKFIQGKKYGIQFSVFSDYADSISFSLYSVNEDYYKYWTSVNKYNLSKEDAYREPIPLYSNIKDGIGIFAGYSDTLVKLY